MSGIKCIEWIVEWIRTDNLTVFSSVISNTIFVVLVSVCLLKFQDKMKNFIDYFYSKLDC